MGIQALRRQESGANWVTVGASMPENMAVWPFKKSFLQRKIQSGLGPARLGPSSATSLQI